MRNQIDDLDTLLTLLRTHGVTRFKGDVFGCQYELQLSPTLEVSTPESVAVELKPETNPLTGLTPEGEEDLFGA